MIYKIRANSAVAWNADQILKIDFMENKFIEELQKEQQGNWNT